MKPLFVISIFSSLLLAQVAAAHEAHVHGTASLDVAVEKGLLSIDLDTPADNLLGFEHAPGSAAEQQQADKITALLGQPEKLFRLSPAAKCVAAKPTLDAPILGGKNLADAHSDIEANYTFFCANPAALANLDVLLFDAFPRLNSIKLQLAGPKGQRGISLQKGQRSVSLK